MTFSLSGIEINVFFQTLIHSATQENFLSWHRFYRHHPSLIYWQQGNLIKHVLFIMSLILLFTLFSNTIHTRHSTTLDKSTQTRECKSEKKNIRICDTKKNTSTQKDNHKIKKLFKNFIVERQVPKTTNVCIVYGIRKYQGEKIFFFFFPSDDDDNNNDVAYIYKSKHLIKYKQRCKFFSYFFFCISQL